MTKRSKSSAGAPIEPGATPDVASPTPDPQRKAGTDTARTIAEPARNGQEKGSGELVGESEVHLDSRGWYVRELPAGVEVRPELWAVGERGARLMRAARPIRLPPAIPSDQLEAFYLRVALDQSIASGISAGRALNYGGAAPAGWERRVQPRPFSGSSVGGPFGSSPGGKLPWSATHVVPDLDGDDQ